VEALMVDSPSAVKWAPPKLRNNQGRGATKTKDMNQLDLPGPF